MDTSHYPHIFIRKTRNERDREKREILITLSIKTPISQLILVGTMYKNANLLITFTCYQSHNKTVFNNTCIMQANCFT